MTMQIMQTKLKQAVRCVGAIALVLALVPMSAFAADEDRPMSGKWGECTWDIVDGTLTVHPGKGEATNHVSPWVGYSDVVERAVFAEEDGNKVIAPGICDGLFQGCSSLSSLDLSGFDTSQATSMAGMFDMCDALASVSVGPAFSFKGATDEVLTTLPDGTWMAKSTGEVYTAQHIAESMNNVSDVYEKSAMPITNVKLSETSFAFDGTEKKPKVSVAYSTFFLQEGTHYRIEWPADVTSAGEKTITVIGIGNCTGTKKVTYSIVGSGQAAEPPKMLDGANGKAWTPDSGEAVSFRSSAPLSEFVEVRLDGNVVSSEHYTIREGSTIIEFKPEFLATLPAGQHTVDIVSKTGVASAPLTVVESLNVAPGDNAQESVPGRDMFRLYNPNSGEHFYTASDEERDYLINAGWTYEGVAWKAPLDGVPVYRFYNPNAGEHHYTYRAEERDHLINAGWILEEGGWFSDPEETVPLYRLYNPNEFANNHHYTTDLDEFLALIEFGWVDEGSAWHGVK